MKGPATQAALKVLHLAVRELINPKARGVAHVAPHRPRAWPMRIADLPER